ncbi:hypothetical protein [Synechococcus sp. MIT S9503]|uniref:hypothetical protein n=1 Tax=Synechococcus sp. MIT S9503 TaxID=3082547 RepID=UPI0039A48CF4
MPSIDSGANSDKTTPYETQAAPEPIVWKVVADTTDPSNISRSDSTTVVWEPLPNNPSAEGDGTNDPTTAIVWEVLPETISPLTPEATQTIAEVDKAEPLNVSISTNERPPADVIAQEETMPSRVIPDPPPPPQLQALDRSIAYADGLVGPDIGWYVPNGFRWSQRWFADAAILGQSRRRDNGPFWGWNDGDAVGILHANLIQTKQWSFGLNTSVRSVYQGDEAAGGSTQIGEGISSGFRIARKIGDTGGISFGGEQVLQWDDKTDTGRNLYLMASKGWWLGDNNKTFPLLIANGGFGTGRFANQDINNFKNPLRFACINNVEDRTDTFAVDNDLCWSPIGSISLVFNEWWGIYTEYRSGRAIAGTSLNLTGGIPLRLNWGVEFARKNELIEAESLTWVFRASLGF